MFDLTVDSGITARARLIFNYLCFKIRSSLIAVNTLELFKQFSRV